MCQKEIEAELAKHPRRSKISFTFIGEAIRWHENRLFARAQSWMQYSRWVKEASKMARTLSEERHFDETTVNGDDYSIINCCGDYQIAPKHVWEEIKGMEEDLIYSLYADTNVQKKSVMHGFELKALYNPALFHIEHGKGGGGFLDGINKLVNDPYRAIVNQEKTLNTESWGFGNTDIEFEIF
jgi:hypothetical protein